MNAIEKAERLKLAVQKSGRLTDHSLELLKNCGLKLSRGRDQLMGFGENMPLDVLFVRDDDIPDLVQEDVCDLGLVGRNVLEEKRLELTARGHAPDFTELRTLDFGRCRLSLAVPEGFTYDEGVVAMANSGAGTTGSQFFIVVGDNARVLNNTFNVLGRVVSGQETIDAIEAVPTSVAPGTNERSRPLETVYIETVEVDG